MSEFSNGEIPKLDQLPEYDHIDVARNVLWPYIKEQRNGVDWTEHGVPGRTVLLPFRGKVDGVLVDVEIEASAEHDDIWSEKILPSIELTVYRHLVGAQREMVINLMTDWRARQGILFGKLPMDKYLRKLDSLEVKVFSRYEIDENEMLQITRAQAVSNQRGIDLWTSEELEFEDIEEDDDHSTYLSRQIYYQLEGDVLLQKHDLEEIETGLIVAQASTLVLDGLRAIKDRPM